MDQDEAGKGGGKGGRAKKGGNKKDMKDMEELLEAVAKLVLIQALHLRELQSIILITIIMDMRARPVLAMKEAGKAYHDKTAGKSPDDHGLGPPAPHIAMALMECLIEDVETSGQELATELKG